MHCATEPLFSFLFDFQFNLALAYLLSFHLLSSIWVSLQLSVSVSLSCQTIFCHSENETIAANVFAFININQLLHYCDNSAKRGMNSPAKNALT